ncbi:16S rRNA (cytosine(967)-C(5))-methyltransferase [hydrothermal vent metagenome]|uniref:16S rRNA (cytosine(967)-C(5))-methyltransferase n=1 Tax=hydrothermal vent metagenome TaxID=652676 RepID=A0A3B0WM69_9ZZZZ
MNKKNKQGKAKVSVARQAALKTLKQVFSGQSLSAIQARTIDSLEDKRDRGLANEIVNGVLRWRWQLEFFTSKLLAKALKKKDIDVQLILLMALYELKECRTPDYAIINDAVELSRKVGKKWAAGLVNAVLRRFTREKEVLVESMRDGQAIYSHPRWILEKVKADWPKNWQQILDANNQRPAFWLRVNQKQYQSEDYQKLLTENDIESQISAFPNQVAASALKLSQGLDVRTLPGFADGAVSVQDVGAQLAAELLEVSGSKQVLDLCAAPGGKTCHLLERYDEIEKVIAVEIEESRVARVSENLQRLQFESRVELIVSDASEYQEWWSGEKFERILIDAPCSASGVIRRHPDIKTLRRESDITSLVEVQASILNAAWQMLAPGGELLYVTCSIFKDENQNQIQAFLSHNNNATETKIDADWGQVCEYGRQLLPGEFDADGFYYCRLKKLSAEK